MDGAFLGGPPPGGDDAPADRADAVPESCGNGLDEDGDGAVDETCGCEPGSVQPCYPAGRFPDEGPCARGVQRCDDSVPEFPEWGACEDAILPADEVCGNGIDEDCDGEDDSCGGDHDGDDAGDDEAEGDDDAAGDAGDDEAAGDDDTAGDGGDDGAAGDDDDDDLQGDPVPALVEETFDYGADPVARPVDFVWAVDQSDSMDDEIAMVRAQINAFAQDLGDSGLDYHVVMLAQRFGDEDHHELCVPEPLAGPNCSDSDRFHAIDVHVESEDSLERITDSIDSIESFFREGSLRVVVVVSDDDSDMDPWTFDAFLRGRGGYDDWVFDGFVGIDEDVCDDIADEGDEYVTLAAMRGGVLSDICLDWSFALETFSEEALRRTASFELADDPDAATLEVSVQHAGGDWEELDGALWDLQLPRTIVLTDDAGLQPGDRIRVEYLPL